MGENIPPASQRTLALPRAAGEGSPLSYFQTRLWFHQERNPDDTSYNLPMLLLITGPLNTTALEQSVNTVLARHEVLRTTYREAAGADGEPLQFVAPPDHIPLDAVPVADRAEMLHHLDRFVEYRFNLRQGPILIAKLLRLPNDHHHHQQQPLRHLLLLNVHHIAADGWSMQSILRGEIQRAYAALSQGQQPPLPPLALQYRDYAREQRAEDLTPHLNYWRKTLRGYEDSLELPTSRSRTAAHGQGRTGSRSGTFTHQYPKEFSQQLARLAREHGCTMFMCLLAGLGVVLSRHGDKRDLCVGTTTSNRSEVELEPLIGFFVNILPLRLNIDEEENATVADLLRAVRSQVLGAFEHPAPFERILQDAVHGVRREGGNPLVPVVMRHQNFPESELGAMLPDGTRFDSYPGREPEDEDVRALLAREHVPARCEIEMSYSGGGEGLEVEVVYAADLYDRALIDRLLAHHERVLEGMFGNGSGRVADLPLLRDAEMAEMLERSERAAPVMELPPMSFLERFDAQAARAPEAVACWDSQGTWTFADLARQSRGVAHALAAKGTKPGDLVAVCLSRGGELLAALLGIWRAGAAYVPIDPAYPPAYSRMIIEDAEPSTIVCAAEHKIPLGLQYDVRCLLMSDCGSPVEEDQPSHPRNPDALAYVMYTSGSTGKPKGVRVPHRQLDTWLANLERMAPFSADDVVGQKTTAVFAAGVKEIFAGLVNGCAQVVISDTTVRDIPRFVDALIAHRVTRLNMLPAHLSAVIDHMRSTGKRLPSLRFCATAGEPLPASVVLAFREVFPAARLFNNYGCTELNDVCYYDTTDFDAAKADFVPIGKPIANTRVYVLDRRGRLVPDGVPGELHAASTTLPEGYHNLEALTAEKFLPNPFGTPGMQPSNRIFNTGDVVRFLPDGNLDYIGRWDLQVKVRGYRIDVRQVERVMSEVAAVRECAVVGKGDRLVVFYTTTPENRETVAEVRAFLAARLPTYMVPDAFVLVDSMPRLPNGKLNRRALVQAELDTPAKESEDTADITTDEHTSNAPAGSQPPPRGSLQQTSGSHEPPRTPTERALADIWAAVVGNGLPASSIGRQSHFFEIGGHSLSAMRVLARVKDAFRVELGLSALFDAPRLEEFARIVEEGVKERVRENGKEKGQKVEEKKQEKEKMVQERERPKVKEKAPAMLNNHGEDHPPTAPAPDVQLTPTSTLLQNKVILITGGSRGIGASASLALASHGATVAINYRDSQSQAQALKSAILASGGVAEIYRADVTSRAEVNSMIDAVVARFGRIDVLVANAHIHFRHESFLDYDLADLERKVSDELRALFYPCQGVVRDMVRRGAPGSIIAVSSTLSRTSVGEGFMAQRTAKAMVDAFVRSLAAELGTQGIRANTVAPGLTDTEAAMPMPEQRKTTIASLCPMRRNAVPEDVAGAIVFFASDMSRFMTGTYAPVDGGYTMI
ncbi:hypothetical protein VTJ49DRAFT_5186 [Mycothermus thermophilus]|uniref:Carrier domain-containing protein n=1 Tax=Humicola insolens TaxID=85995 RepID=A0ABR3VKW9_HUMIN